MSGTVRLQPATMGVIGSTFVISQIVLFDACWFNMISLRFLLHFFDEARDFLSVLDERECVDEVEPLEGCSAFIEAVVIGKEI